MDLLCCIPYYMAYLARALETQNVRATFGSVNYYLDDQYFPRLGVRTDPGLLDVVSRLKIRRPLLRRPLRVVELGINMMALAVRFAVSKPDLIHVQYLSLLEKGFPFELWFLRYAKKLGIPFVYTVHNILPPETALRHMAAFRRAYNMADALICTSEGAKSSLVREFSVNPERIWIIPHGPLFHDVTRPSPEDARARMGFSKGQRIVLCQGILRPYKGVGFLLEAWPLVQMHNPKARLIIAGTGKERYLRGIEEKVQSLGISRSVRLDFRFVRAEELPVLYQAADILVYPYEEITTSGALLTGLSYGKPVVATSLPAFREALGSGEYALLIEYGDVEGLATALTRLIQDPVEYGRLQCGAASALRAQTDWTKIGQETRRCYEGVLTARCNRTSGKDNRRIATLLRTIWHGAMGGRAGPKLI